MLIFGSAWAQQGTDIVTLRNGAVYRGSIIEKIPTQHVLFKTLDGRQLTFPMDEVKSAKMNVTSKVKVKVPQPPIEVKNGYFNNTEFGLMFGLQEYGGISARPTVNMVNGYQFGRYSLGAGIGFATMRNQHYLPLFLDARAYLRKNESFSPYVSVQGGYAWGLANRNNYSPYYLIDFIYLPEDQKGRGPFGALQLGIRKYTSDRFGFNLSMGARVQRDRAEYTDWHWNGNESIPVNVVEITRMIRSEFRFGIYFN